MLCVLKMQHIWKFTKLWYTSYVSKTFKIWFRSKCYTKNNYISFKYMRLNTEQNKEKYMSFNTEQNKVVTIHCGLLLV